MVNKQENEYSTEQGEYDIRMIIYLHHYQTEEHQQNDDVSVMFEHERLSKEFLFIDYTILAYFSLTSRLGRC